MATCTEGLQRDLLVAPNPSLGSLRRLDGSAIVPTGNALQDTSKLVLDTLPSPAPDPCPKVIGAVLRAVRGAQDYLAINLRTLLKGIGLGLPTNHRPQHREGPLRVWPLKPVECQIQNGFRPEQRGSPRQTLFESATLRALGNMFHAPRAVDMGRRTVGRGPEGLRWFFFGGGGVAGGCSGGWCRILKVAGGCWVYKLYTLPSGAQIEKTHKLAPTSLTAYTLSPTAIPELTTGFGPVEAGVAQSMGQPARLAALTAGRSPTANCWYSTATQTALSTPSSRCVPARHSNTSIHYAIGRLSFGCVCCWQASSFQLVVVTCLLALCCHRQVDATSDPSEGIHTFVRRPKRLSWGKHMAVCSLLMVCRDQRWGAQVSNFGGGGGSIQPSG